MIVPLRNGPTLEFTHRLHVILITFDQFEAYQIILIIQLNYRSFYACEINNMAFLEDDDLIVVVEIYCRIELGECTRSVIIN